MRAGMAQDFSLVLQRYDFSHTTASATVDYLLRVGVYA
jgi:hypothetical protein